MSTIHALSLADSSDAEDRLLSFIEEAEQQRSYLKWLAGRITAGSDDAEDIVQQALLKAFLNLPNFRGDARMRTWLHTIVLNTAREHLRNRKRRVPLHSDASCENEDGDAFRDLPHPDASPEDFCAQNEIDAILHSEIDVLTPFCKRAIEMCVMRELPYREAARELKTNVATLKSRVYRAKELLRRAMYMRNLGPCKLLTAQPLAGSHSHAPAVRRRSSQKD